MLSDEAVILQDLCIPGLEVILDHQNLVYILRLRLPAGTVEVLQSLVIWITQTFFFLQFAVQVA